MVGHLAEMMAATKDDQINLGFRLAEMLASLTEKDFQMADYSEN